MNEVSDTMSNQVYYAVLAESGEYSDRQVWLAGIFDNESLAQRMVESKSTIVRICNQYEISAHKVRTRLREGKVLWYYEYKWDPIEGRARNQSVFNEELFNEIEAEVIRQVGPRPECEPGERFQVVKVNLNEWGHYGDE